jgi:hypothetical protein
MLFAGVASGKQAALCTAPMLSCFGPRWP